MQTVCYAGGGMKREEERAPDKPVTEQLLDLLRANPGILTKSFEELAAERGLGRNKARQFLDGGVAAGTIRRKAEGPKHHHFWRGDDTQGSFN